MRPLLRNDDGKHRYEDAGMEIVTAIKREFLPSMDSNDGGEILSWLTHLCDRVWVDATAARDAAIWSKLHANADKYLVGNDLFRFKEVLFWTRVDLGSSLPLNAAVSPVDGRSSLPGEQTNDLSAGDPDPLTLDLEKRLAQATENWGRTLENYLGKLSNAEYELTVAQQAIARLDALLEQSNLSCAQAEAIATSSREANARLREALKGLEAKFTADGDRAFYKGRVRQRDLYHECALAVSAAIKAALSPIQEPEQ